MAEQEATNTTGLKVIHPVYYANDLVYPFIHALKLAQISGGELEIVDVRSENEATEHIGVRSVLEQWKVLPAGSHRSDVAQIGLRVKKIVREGNKKKEIQKRFEKHEHDLMVLGIPKKQSNGFHFFGIAEQISHSFGDMTLFVPSQGKPFVNENTGETSLTTVLIPVANQKCFDASVQALKKMLQFLPSSVEEIIMLYAGTDFPEIRLNSDFEFRFREEIAPRPLIDALIGAAESHNADLIVMATKARSSVLQKFTGSNTEQVSRKLPCPLLSVPLL